MGQGMTFRLPIRKGGGEPVIAVIPLPVGSESVIHDTTAQTPEEEAWLKQDAEDS